MPSLQIFINNLQATNDRVGDESDFGDERPSIIICYPISQFMSSCDMYDQINASGPFTLGDKHLILFFLRSLYFYSKYAVSSFFIALLIFF